MQNTKKKKKKKMEKGRNVASKFHCNSFGNSARGASRGSFSSCDCDKITKKKIKYNNNKAKVSSCSHRWRWASNNGPATKQQTIWGIQMCNQAVGATNEAPLKSSVPLSPVSECVKVTVFASLQFFCVVSGCCCNLSAKKFAYQNSKRHLFQRESVCLPGSRSS